MKPVFKTLSNLFTSVDLLGGTLSFSIKHGSTTFKTAFGALLTLACFGMIIWYTIIVINTILDRTNPNVLCTRESDIDKTEYHFSDTNLAPVLFLLNKKNQTTQSLTVFSSLTTIKADLWNTRYDYDKFINIEKIIPIEVKPCVSLSNKKPYRWIFENEAYTATAVALYCLDIPENLKINVRGGRSSSDMTALRVFAYPCSLPNQADCINPSLFSEYTLMAVNLKKYFKFSDFDNPIRQSFYAREEINIQRNVASKLFQFLKKTVIRDETNYVQPKHEDLLAEDIEREEYSGLERDGSTYCLESAIQSGSCQSYVTIEYRSSGLQDTCVRSYTNIIDAVSNIGGFKELVFMGVVVVYTFYNDFSKNHQPQDLQPFSISGNPHTSMAAFGRDSSGFPPDTQDLTSQPQTRQAESNRSEKAILDRFKGSMKEDVMSVIEEVTSIPTMIRELAAIRVIKEIFFEKHHLKLLPLVHIEMERKRRQQEIAAHTRNKSEIMPSLISFLNDALDFRTAISMLRRKKRSLAADGEWALPSDQPRATNPFRDAIDQFFLDNLPEFVQRDAGLSPDEELKGSIEIPLKGLAHPRAESTAQQAADKRHAIESNDGANLQNMDFFSP